MLSSDSKFPEADQPQGFFGHDFDPLSDTVAYPQLDDTEIAEVAPFGERWAFAENEALFSAGDYPFNSYVILSGRVRAVDVSTGKRVVFARYGAGYFTGDIDLLTRRPAIVSVEAETSVEAIRLTPKQLRNLFTRRPQLGEKFWKSYQRRRELLLTSQFRGLTVYGRKGDKATLETGVYYSATNVEARLCRSSAVHVVGGGNSAGQAAMFLSQTAEEVSLLVRGPDLRKMSSYLSERVLANRRIRIRYNTEVVGIEGVDQICGVHVRERNGEVHEEFTSGLFVFIGAKPRTEFLPHSIVRNDQGFLLTGQEVASLSLWKEPRRPCTVETSLPGVFAAGDCRSGSPKRVAFAIGDGSTAVASVHKFLENRFPERRRGELIS